MISKKAQDFWTLLKSYPKQIEMPLAQARAADLHAGRFYERTERCPLFARSGS